MHFRVLDGSGAESEGNPGFSGVVYSGNFIASSGGDAVFPIVTAGTAEGQEAAWFKDDV